MTMDWQVDGELLERWRAGDQEAGEELFERHVHAISRFFSNKVSTGVEDLVQLTFLALVEGKDRVRDGTTMRAYLLSIAYNVMCKHIRGLNRGQLVDHSMTRMIDLAPGPSSIAAKRKERKLVLQALRRLPIEHQIALELTYWEELKSAEIAEIVGISASALRSRLAKARALLREEIEKLAESPQALHESLTDLEDWASKLKQGLPGSKF